MAAKVENAKVAGTTAVGKTDLSLELAKLLNGEVVSADSVQIYRHMDIGSAKIDTKSQLSIPHHLINMTNINDQFTAGDYYKLATSTIEDIISRGKVPIVVGGTGLYINFLMSGLTGAPESTNSSRTAIDNLLEEDNNQWKKSLARLHTLDPVYAACLLPNDWYRLKRGLDICLQSNRTVTSFKPDTVYTQCLPYEFKCLFLTMPRIKLFNRIDYRCEQIIEAGLLKETVSLIHYHNLKPDTPAGSSIGYNQTLQYLSNEWGYPGETTPTNVTPITQTEASKNFLDYLLGYEARTEARKHFLDYLLGYQARTRRLARKQLVWFKTRPQFHWLNIAPEGERLPLQDVAERTVLWFNNNIELPCEWNGAKIQSLSTEENALLKTYTTDQKLQIFNNDDAIDKILINLKQYIQEIKNL